MKRPKNTLKFIFLTLTLLLPVGIYLFLRFFGQNQFEIPVYYSHGIPEDSAICAKINQSHSVDASELLTLNKTSEDILKGKISVIAFLPEFQYELTEWINTLNRISGVFDEQMDFQVIMIEKKDTENNANRRINIKSIKSDPEKIKKFAICQLILINFNELKKDSYKDIVLIAGLQRIRGYYKINDFDEMDRLILEVKILLNERKG